MKIFVVYKKSVYQKYVLDERNARLKKLIKARDPSVRQLLSNHHRHQEALQTVATTLDQLGVTYLMSNRTVIPNFRGYDLVITIGGDGTFLRVSHSVKHQLILGVNSVPETSVGANCSITIDSFEKKIAAILSGQYKIKELTRIAILVNKKELPLNAVNDILYTNISPAATSRYILSFKKITENHVSSGLWIATPSGSSAAIHAAGGKKQKHTENKLQFLVREPYQGIYHPYKLTHGFMTTKTPLVITSKMIKSRIYIDGPTNAHTVEYGDKIELKPAQNPLNVII